MTFFAPPPERRRRVTKPSFPKKIRFLAPPPSYFFCDAWIYPPSAARVGLREAEYGGGTTPQAKKRPMYVGCYSSTQTYLPLLVIRYAVNVLYSRKQEQYTLHAHFSSACPESVCYLPAQCPPSPINPSLPVSLPLEQDKCK